jgi:hypothetical protein
MTYVSPTNSKILYGTKPHVAADGLQQAVVKVRLRDHNNRPVANKQVEILTDRQDGVNIIQPQRTDAEGLALAFITATDAGEVTVSARVLPD